MGKDWNTAKKEVKLKGDFHIFLTASITNWIMMNNLLIVLWSVHFNALGIPAGNYVYSIFAEGELIQSKVMMIK